MTADLFPFVVSLLQEKESYTVCSNWERLTFGSGGGMSNSQAKAMDDSGASFQNLLDLLGQITAQDTVDAMCRTVVEGVRKYLGFERAGLFLWDELAGRYRGTFGTDLEGVTRPEPFVLLGLEDAPGGPVDQIIAGAAIVRGCDLGQPKARPGEENVKADLIGLRARGRLYGIMSVDNRLSQRPISDGDLRQLALISTVLGNAMEIVKASNDLARSEERFRQVAENSGEWIWEIDPAGRYTYCSPVVRAILGREPEEMLGRRLEEFVSDEDRRRVSDEIARALAQQVSIRRLGHTQIRKDHRKVILVTSGLPVRDAAGVLRGYRGAHRDVTRETELEAQLRHSQKMEVIGRLAGGVAHDFNNLLTSIIGCSGLLLEDLKPEDPRRLDVEQIKLAGNRAANLTRQLMAFGRRQVIRVERVDLNTVVRDMEKLLRRTVGEDIEVVTDLDPHAGTVMGDADQIAQIIMQLAINARDAMLDTMEILLGSDVFGATRPIRPVMTSGVKRLSITTRAAAAAIPQATAGAATNCSGESYVILAVSDTGIGMSDEVKEHLFEPFFTTKEVGQGSGLGLSTVYGIVKQMGGEIRVTSELGKGTTFEISLKQAASPLAASAPRGARSGGGPETVLVVEDEEMVRNLTVRMLNTLGYQVVKACDGIEALQVAAAYPGRIDLLLTDMVMPQMNGKRLVEQLRKTRSDFKVLFVSGYSAADTVGTQKIGVDVPLIQKPFTRDQLAARIRSLLDGK